MDSAYKCEIYYLDRCFLQNYKTLLNILELPTFFLEQVNFLNWGNGRLFQACNIFSDCFRTPRLPTDQICPTEKICLVFWLFPEVSNAACYFPDALAIKTVLEGQLHSSRSSLSECMTFGLFIMFEIFSPYWRHVPWCLHLGFSHITW